MYLETLYQLVDFTMQQVGHSILYDLTGGTGDKEDIDVWESKYSDDDDEIYFTHKELLDYLQQIEEDSLFKVGLIQAEEEALETAYKESKIQVEEKQRKIDLQN